MGFSKSILLLIFSFSVNFFFSFAVIPYFQSSCVRNNSFNGSDTYWNNLDRLPTQISSTNSNNIGFYNLTVGGSPGEVNAIGICRGDANQDVCKTCLYDSVLLIRQNCPKNTEAVGWSGYCMLRYSNRNIFLTEEFWPSSWRRNNATGAALTADLLEAADGVPQPSPPATSPPAEGKSRDNSVTIPVVGSLLGVVSIVLCICVTIRLRKALKKDGPLDEILKAESLKHDFATVQAATNNFSDENKLGQGGFGPVYKGQLPSGQDVAVKRLSSCSGQGDSEFENEVLLVAKLQHRNLVRLIGFCLKGKERLLIYEFVPNASLDHFIFDPTKSAQLNWERRYRIIGGIARGLLYLHEDSQLRVIHRDLKPSNILLDAEMNPKIADFGMAKLSEVDDSHESETIRKVVGTYGYMAPEYVKHGRFSIKSDVYSFGVLVLEIISGQKNNSRRHGEEYALNLLALASKNWREGTLQSIVDPNLSDASMADIMKCIHVSLLCVQENELLRPTMGSIVLMLTSDSASLPTPSETAFSVSTATQSEASSSRENWHASASTNEVSITQLYPR